VSARPGGLAGGSTHLQQRGRVKCVVWDLDNTVWDGILLEDTAVTVRPEIAEIIRLLDGRGILHSVASRNDPAIALERLGAAGLADYLLYPQIGWNPKSTAIRTVAESLSIGVDSIAFVDDQPFELAEVAHALPEVLGIDAASITAAVAQPAFEPRFITDESRQRREMYRSSQARDALEAEFEGTSEAFLATLGMRMRIAPAEPQDLARCEELTIRTNQLNATGRTYSYEELAALRTSPDHLLLVASLEDRFGSYGTIGLALVERRSRPWHLRLLLMSCRVVSRGVGTILLNHVMRLAAAAGAGLRADFVPTPRNRMMYIAYRFAGFVEVSSDGDTVVLETGLDRIQSQPSYVELVAIE